MILQGNCKEVLKTLEAESVNMAITSPPYYNLRDYKTGTWSGGDEKCDHVIEESTRFGKTAKVAQNMVKHNTKLYKRVCEKCGAIREDEQIGREDTPVEFINNLCDVFDEVKRVLRKDGTCFVNLGDSYDKHKSLMGIPEMFMLEMKRRGWHIRNVIIWKKPNCMPYAGKDRFTIDFEQIFFFSKNRKYYFKQQFEGAIVGNINYDQKKKEEDRSIRFLESVFDQDFGDGPEYEDRNKRAVWDVPTAARQGEHYATYPEELLEIPIDACCPEGGVVLDPFFGSGTTGVVAMRQNKKYIGIDLNPEFIAIAKERLASLEFQSKVI